MKDLSESGKIDKVSNLKSAATFIFSGLEDKVVPPKNQQAIREVYDHFKVGKLEYIEDDIGHQVPEGGAVDSLKWLYEALGYADTFEPAGAPRELGNLFGFDQAEFIPSDWSFEDSKFDEKGLVYVPNVCTVE